MSFLWILWGYGDSFVFFLGDSVGFPGVFYGVSEGFFFGGGF
jgi:hypothetical protein